MKKLLRAICEDGPLYTFMLGLFIAILGLGLHATAAPQGETQGTLPTIHKTTAALAPGEVWTIDADGMVLVVSSSEGGSSFDAATSNPIVWSTSWVSHGQTHKLEVPQGIGEDDGHWAARCHDKLAALQHVFPPDPPAGG